MKFDRVYHPVSLWEEVGYNMWGDVADSACFLERAISFTGDHELYGNYMLQVALNWRYSCENALTDYSLNRKAWIGHAACALAIGCPEDITRKAWGFLTNEQRALANAQAESAIRVWERRYASSIGVPFDMDEPVLL
jgi:hypothetical protein